MRGLFDCTLRAMLFLFAMLFYSRIAFRIAPICVQIMSLFNSIPVAATAAATHLVIWDEHVFLSKIGRKTTC